MRLRSRFGWHSALPRVVGADVPEVAFEVAAGEGAAAVVHVAMSSDDGRAGGFGGGVDGIGVGDDEVEAFGLAQIDLVGLNDVLAVFAAVIDGAEHDHAVAEGELGVGDGVVVGSDVDGIFLEAEGADEPVDGGEGIAVAEAGDEGGFGLIAHGCKGCHCGEAELLSEMPKYRLELGGISPRRGWRHGRL